MNGRTIFAVVLVLALAAGAAWLGVAAYNAGVAAGIASAGSEAGAVVMPYYGWHPGAFGFGFGFLGFLGTLLFLFLVFGLIRAALWGGSRGRWGGPPGSGHGRWPDHGGFEEWHRRQHAEDGRPEATA